MTPHNDLLYVDEKLTNAISDMVTSDKSLADRIHDAVISHLHVLKVEDFPGDLRESWESLFKMLTAVDLDNDQGSFRNSIDAMKPRQLQKAANEIFDLYHGVQYTIVEMRLQRNNSHT